MKSEHINLVGMAMGTALLLVTLYFGARVISAGWNAGKE
jgi:hypothetical protein